MGTYGNQKFRIIFQNSTLADIFALDLQVAERDENKNYYEVVRENDTTFFLHAEAEQEKLVWTRETAAATLIAWMGTKLHLSENLINKCARTEMSRYSTGFFWDLVDGEVICDRAKGYDEIDLEAIAEDYDLDELLGDWAYDSEWIYDDDICTDETIWDQDIWCEENQENKSFEEYELTDRDYNRMARSFVDYLIRTL